MLSGLSARLSELERIVANMIRPGIISAVNLGGNGATPKVKVKIGDNATGWLPWAGNRAAPSGNQSWGPPEQGEQVIVLSPSGDYAQGYVVPGVYQNSALPPSNSADVSSMKFKDGGLITYDRAAHALAATIPAGGNATVKISGLTFAVTDSGVTITGGTLTVDGDIKSTGGDVLAGSISLRNHTHSDPQGGNVGTATG